MGRVLADVDLLLREDGVEQQVLLEGVVTRQAVDSRGVQIGPVQVLADQSGVQPEATRLATQLLVHPLA